MVQRRSRQATECLWLDLTRAVVTAPQGRCICRITGARWSGYLGSGFVDRVRPNARVLFVGANHNGGPTGLGKTPAMAQYNALLSRWAISPRCATVDDELLVEMRDTYTRSWPFWGAVWRNILKIREKLGIDDADFAFVNLARCPDPQGLSDDSVIPACQAGFPLKDLVEAIDARVVFLAKDNDVGRAIVIPDELELRDFMIPIPVDRRLVIRYDNGWSAMRNSEPLKAWLPREAKNISLFLNA